MKTAFVLLVSVGMGLAFAACGGQTAKECPNPIGNGVACNSAGLACSYTQPVIWCDGPPTQRTDTCTCNGSFWSCPEVGQPKCPSDGGLGGCVEGTTKPVGDGCNTCTCSSGVWGCTKIACLDSGTTPVSDPGKLVCGTSTCAVPGNYCCDSTGTGGAAKCVPLSTSACGGLRRSCDEAADCAQGVCCIPPNAALTLAYHAECVTTCKNDPQSYQLCKSSGECENGKPCVTQICNGYLIATCGPLPANRCN